MDPDGNDIPFDEVEYDAFSMNKSSETDIMEDSERGGMYNGQDYGISDRLMFGSASDDPDYVAGLIAEFERTQDLLEDVECRLSVAAMVSDAVMNGIAKALLKESSEALAAKEAEIFALNEKLEDRDLKLWKVTETLQFKEEELAMHVAESKSDQERLVSDFMYHKEQMKRRLHDAEAHCVEKEKRLVAKTETMKEMTSKSEADRNRIIAMEEQIKSLQEIEVANRREISDLVRELKNVKSQHYSGNVSTTEDNTQIVISKYEGQLVEREDQILRQEIERCICENVYEGLLLELKDTIETDRLQFTTQEMDNLKEYTESKLMEKGFEVFDLAEQLKEKEVCYELQTSINVGVLETSIQESQHQMSQLVEALDSKDEQISSLTGMLSRLRKEHESLQAQISSNHVIDAEIENNLSTLKATMDNQCTRLKEDLEKERIKIKDVLSRITRLQTLNNSLAHRLREQQTSLEQVEEKQAAQQWQQGIEWHFVKEVYGSKLNEAMQLITSQILKLEEKDREIASQLESIVALQVALNAERSEVLRLQERLEALEFQIDSLSSTGLEKVDSAIDVINAKFLQMNLSLDSFEKTSETCFERIQSQLASFEEKFLEKQWEKSIEEEISRLVLDEFLQGLEGWLKAKEWKERTSQAIQIRWDEGRVALMNEIKGLRQELEHFKHDEPVKSAFIVDGSNSNGFQNFSQRTQEVQNGETTDGQRKDWAMRRYSTGQVCADTKSDDASVSQLTHELKNGHSLDASRKDSRVRRFSMGQLNAGQVCADTKSDDASVSQLTHEVKNGQSLDASRKDWPVRRFSTGQLNADITNVVDGRESPMTGKLLEGDSTKLDLSWIAIESADSPDSPLKNLPRDGLISHFKRVVLELKRQTEHIVEEKTEEIYRLKRDLLRGKDGTHLKKDKELNVLKKRITEFTKTLDKIVEENDKLSLPPVEDHHKNNELVGKLIDEMQAEKRHLLQKVREKEDELKAHKLSDALRRVLRESHLLNHIANLESEREAHEIMNLYEVDILVTLFNETINEKENALNLIMNAHYENINEKLSIEKLMHDKDRALDLVVRDKEELKKQIIELECEKEVIGILNICEVDLLCTLFKETIKEREIVLNLKLKEQDENIKQKLYLQKMMHEKERDLDLAIGEKEEHKKRIALLEKMIEEKDNNSGSAQSELEEIEKFEKLNFSLDLALKGCEELKKQKVQFETIIQAKDDIIDSSRREQEKLKKQVLSLKEAIEEKDNGLKMVVRDLEDKKNLLTMSMKKEQDQRRQFEATIAEKENAEKQCKRELTDFFHRSMDVALQLECAAMGKIEENVLRLERAKHDMKKLQGQAYAFVRKNAYYKDQLERKSRDQQKAEEEVDLLGDEVDDLLSLLEKVYVALDHYLPVLQHYPGVVELVKLIKRELIDREVSGL